MVCERVTNGNFLRFKNEVNCPSSMLLVLRLVQNGREKASAFLFVVDSDEDEQNNNDLELEAVFCDESTNEEVFMFYSVDLSLIDTALLLLK
jgi:hypothetical protein